MAESVTWFLLESACLPRTVSSEHSGQIYLRIDLLERLSEFFLSSEIHINFSLAQILRVFLRMTILIPNSLYELDPRPMPDSKTNIDMH